MRASILLCIAMISTAACLLSACAGGGAASTPSLGAQAPQTGRVPSAGNIRGTQQK